MQKNGFKVQSSVEPLSVISSRIRFLRKQKCKTNGVQEASYFDQFIMTEKRLEFDGKNSHQRT